MHGARNAHALRPPPVLTTLGAAIAGPGRGQTTKGTPPLLLPPPPPLLATRTKILAADPTLCPPQLNSGRRLHLQCPLLCRLRARPPPLPCPALHPIPHVRPRAQGSPPGALPHPPLAPCRRGRGSVHAPGCGRVARARGRDGRARVGRVQVRRGAREAGRAPPAERGRDRARRGRAEG